MSLGSLRRATPLSSAHYGCGDYRDWTEYEASARGHQLDRDRRARAEEMNPPVNELLQESEAKPKESGGHVMSGTGSGDLWGGVRIPIIMVSGAVNSGKTLFGLTVDPNTRKLASEVHPTTLVYDQEGSSDSYAGSLNFEHKDTRAAVAAGVHMERIAAGPQDPRWLRILKEQADCNDSPAAAMFRAWFLSLLKVETGKYAVGVCDTFTPLQDGMVDWLKRHPEAFGRTVNEYTRASSMFLWPDVKAMLAHVLAVECRLRFQTFVLTVHLKNEWAGGAKTGRQVAEGLDVLEKLATVHLELDRSPKKKGKEAPRVPSAILKKERLVRFGATGDEDRPILPPRLPVCTPDAIRKYIIEPPDFAKLAADERLPDDSLSDDQKLLIEQEMARNQAEAAKDQLSALEMARAAAATGMAQAASLQSPQPQPSEPDRPAPLQTISPHVPQPDQTAKVLAKPQQVQEIVDTMKFLFASGAEAQEWLLEKRATNSVGELTETEAMGVLSELLAMKHAKLTPAPLPPAPAAANDGRATKDQRDKIRDLTVSLYGDKAGEEQSKFLQSLGYGSAQSLTHLQAAERITYLESLAAPKEPRESPF